MPAHLQNRLALGTQELADLLGVSHTHVRNVVLSGKLPSFRFGERLLIPMEAIHQLIDGAFGGPDGETE
jgi:excisionase family DNA binding protein